MLTTLSVRSEALTPSDLFAAASTPFDILLPGFTNAFIQSPDGFWNFYSVWYPDGVFAHLEAAAFLGLPVLALAAGGAFLRRSRPLAPRRRRPDRDPGDRGVPAGDPRRHPVPQRHPVAGAGVHGRGGPDRRDRGHGRRADRSGSGCGHAGRWSPCSSRRWRSRITVWLVLARPDTFDQLVDTFTTFGNLADAQSRHELAVDALTAPWPLVAQIAAGVAMLAVLFAAVRSGPGERFARFRPAFPALLVLVAAAPLVAFGPLPNGTREVTALSSAGTPFMTAAHEAGPYRMATLNPPGYYVGMPDQPAANGVADLRMFSSLNLRATDEVVALAVRDDADGQAIRRVARRRHPRHVRCAVPGRDRVDVGRGQGDVLPRRGGAAAAVVGPVRRRAVVDAVDEPDPAHGGDAGRRRRARLGGRGDRPRCGRRPASSTTVDAPEDGYVWFDVAWWPGWQATVDGAGVAPMRALGGMLVPVTAGTHRVELALVPWDALAGLVLGIVAVGVALAWVARGRRRQPLGSTTIVTSGVIPE